MKIVNNFFSKKISFGILMGVSALTLSLSAAYYSIFGLSSMFAGAKNEVIIMASALEFSKLIVVTYLHNNWNTIGKILKTYLTTVVTILMLITSAGIYGFLTSAYQTTSDQLTILDKQTDVVNLKKDRFIEQLNEFKNEKEQLNTSIANLSNGLSNNVIQYTDKNGNVVTTTSSATRTTLELQLNDSKIYRDKLSLKIESLSDSITQLDLLILNMESNNTVAAEIGPLRYISKLTNKSMDVIVNWFTLLIVFVFDPLAVAMIISINKYIGKTEVHPKHKKNKSSGSASDLLNPILSEDDVDTIIKLLKNESNSKSNNTIGKNNQTQLSNVKVPDINNTNTKKQFYNEVISPKKRYNDTVAVSEGKK